MTNHSEYQLPQREEVLSRLNALLEFELSGVTRYLHYSFMIFGPHRIPITKWLRDQATDGFNHATALGEWITDIGGHPSVRVSSTPEGNKHDVQSILIEALEFERAGLKQYEELLKIVEGKSLALEEFLRDQICAEQQHIFEMDKMLRR